MDKVSAIIEALGIWGIIAGVLITKMLDVVFFYVTKGWTYWRAKSSSGKRDRILNEYVIISKMKSDPSLQVGHFASALVPVLLFMMLAIMSSIILFEAISSYEQDKNRLSAEYLGRVLVPFIVWITAIGMTVLFGELISRAFNRIAYYEQYSNKVIEKYGEDVVIDYVTAHEHVRTAFVGLNPFVKFKL